MSAMAMFRQLTRSPTLQGDAVTGITVCDQN